jgi:hypothetical protein
VAAPKSGQARTIEKVARYIAPDLWDDPVPRWPPDVFALVAYLLEESGAYARVVKQWPPGIQLRTADWTKDILGIGGDWRNCFARATELPPEVGQWWEIVRASADVEIPDIESNSPLCEALLQLCATADEACVGVGVPSGVPADEFDKHAQACLRRASSLCELVHNTSLRVLPKLHTPQTGITLRSLTHHLAMCRTGTVKVIWHQNPSGPDRLSINLLLIPAPEAVAPSQFRPATPRIGNLVNMPHCYGFFDFHPVSGKHSTAAVGLFERAKELVGHVDGVVFPESALTPGDAEAIRKDLTTRSAFLIAGVSDAATGDAPGRNYVECNFPISEDYYIPFKQHKHHRWVLDKRQVIQYGLGGALNTTCGWWEHMELRPRELNFMAMKPWLTLCVLICEDLARPDPAAEIVRAIGPNLVIALLMDGPQLAARWPARYATVLADDPGCSVLTLTSAGMARLSRPNHAITPRAPVVALWKDAKTGVPIEIELPPGAQAIVLSMSVEYHEEWTADGRADGSAAGYPLLVGVHPIMGEGRSGS